MFFKRTVNHERLDRVAVLYLGYKFLAALYFTYPIFYEYATQAITPLQVGFFFSVIGMAGLITEIPTGIIADKRSRKFSGLLGMALAAIAPLVIFFGHTFYAYLVAALFYGVGRAFLNGALDSLVYDHKNISKIAYRKINMFEITAGQAGILVSAACGGIFFSVNQGLPFIAEAIAGCICFILIARMQEEYKDDYARPTASHRHHFIQSMKYLVSTSYLRAIVLMGATFSVMLGMCIQFVHEAAMIEHGFGATGRGLIVSGAGIATLIILNLFLLKVLKRDSERIVYIGFGAVAAYMLLGSGIVSFFLAGYLLWCCLNATSSFIRVMLQDQIPGSHRSTILSSFKTLAILIGMAASTGTGLLIQNAQTPRAAYVLFGGVSIVVLIPCALWLVAHLKRKETAL